MTDFVNASKLEWDGVRVGLNIPFGAGDHCRDLGDGPTSEEDVHLGCPSGRDGVATFGAEPRSRNGLFLHTRQGAGLGRRETRQTTGGVRKPCQGIIVKCLSLGHRFMSVPTPDTIDSAVCDPIASIWVRSVPVIRCRNS